MFWMISIAAIVLLIFSMVRRLALTVSLESGLSPIKSPFSLAPLTGVLSVTVQVSFATVQWQICARILLSRFQVAQVRATWLFWHNNVISKSR